MRHPREYRAKHVNPVYLKIRIAKRGSRATPEEIAEVLQEVSRTGVVPDGWRISATNWRHPNSSGSGGALDIAAFRSLIRHMIDDLQISPVKRTR